MTKAIELIKEIEESNGSLQIAIDALKQISQYEFGYGSRQGKVDISEVYGLQKIADVALDKMGMEK